MHDRDGIFVTQKLCIKSNSNLTWNTCEYYSYKLIKAQSFKTCFNLREYFIFFFQSWKCKKFSFTKYRWNNRTWKLNRSIYIEIIELINFELDPIRTNSLHVAHFLIAIRNKSNRNAKSIWTFLNFMSLIFYGRVTIKIKRKYLFNKLSNTLLNVPFRLYNLHILYFN